MSRIILVLCVTVFYLDDAASQESDLGVFYGRFYAIYKFSDQGGAYKNNGKYNYNFLPSVVVNKYYSDRFSIEAGIFFTLYEQHYGTRKMELAYNSTHIAGHIVLRGGYSLIKSKEFECRIKGGVSLGVAGVYKWDYVVVAYNPTLDSITRGVEKKDFTPIFPMLSTGIDMSYKLSKRFKISLAANYQKGFIKITEYDIYYNDGNGNNDQRAKQWGTGDFYGVQLGVRYSLKNKNGENPGKK